MHSSYDVIIVGAGLSGIIAASLWQAQGYRVLCIDANKKPDKMTDQRAIIITHSSWQACQAKGLDMPYTSTLSQVDFFAQSTPYLSFTAAEVGAPVLGYVFDLPTFVEKALATIPIAWESALTGIHFKQKWQLTVRQKEETKCFSAPLIIAADGHNSALRRWSGIRLRSHALGYQAWVQPVEGESRHPFFAMQAQGTMAYLPKSDDRGVVVWTTPNHLSPNLDDLSSFGLQSTEDSLQNYPLKSQRAYAAAKPGLVLIGEARCCVPPMAAQGLNMGIRHALEALNAYQASNDIRLRSEQMNQDFSNFSFAYGLSHAPLLGSLPPASILAHILNKAFKRL